MYLAKRLRQLRESKDLSQGDMEARTGLLRFYISRVENGHSVPALETLEKISQALETPMYQLFYEGEELPRVVIAPEKGRDDWASKGSGFRIFQKMRSALSRMTERDRSLLLYMAGEIVNYKRGKRDLTKLNVSREKEQKEFGCDSRQRLESQWGDSVQEE